MVKDAAGTVVATGANGAAQAGDGSTAAVTFTPISYTTSALAEAEKEGLATHEGNVWTVAYTVCELTEGLPAGVEPVEGADSFDITVTLTDNGDGTLTPAVAYPDGADGLVFANSYAGGAEAHATLEAGKHLAGASLADGDYSVTFTDVTDADAPETQTVPVKATSGTDGTFELPLTFTVDDLAGVPYADDGTRSRTFAYKIEEVVGHKFGITYDASTYFAYVTLTDDGQGALAASDPVYTDADGNALDAAPTFVNAYGDAEFTPWGAKETDAAEGVDLSGAGFSFTVTDDATGAVVATGTSGANGAISFTAIKVSEGTHAYTISELSSGAQGDDQTGITYDATRWRLTLDAQLQPDGTYAFNPVYTNLSTGEQADGVFFHNAYRSTDAQVSLSATKTITAPHTAAGFSFLVTDVLSGEVVSTGVSQADGSVAFSPIYYKYDAQAAAEPTPAEPTTPAADANASADAGSGGAGTQATEPTADAGTSDNAAGEPAADAGAADGAGTTDDGEPAAGQPDGGAANEPAEPAADAQAPVLEALAQALTPTVAVADDESTDAFAADVAVQAVSPTSSDLGDHWYAVTEMMDGQLGVTYDTRWYMVRVSVTDDGLGHMAAAVTDVVECWTDEAGATQQVDRGADVSAVMFANEYAPTQPAVVTLSGTKTLTGRDAAAGEFSFTVRDADGQVVAGGASAAATAGTPGAITFGSFEVSAPGDYAYTVTEDKGGTTAAGVTYDPATFVVTVHAEDAGDGTIVASVTSVTKDGVDAGEAGIAFANAYRADAGVSVTPEGTKTLTGRDAKAGEFGFVVTDASGAAVATGTSSAAKAGEAGAIAFTPISFTEPGEFDFTVTEVNGGKTQGGVTYSSASFAVHVSVTDNLDGTLSAQVTYPNGAIAFTNAYTEPAPGPEPDNPPAPDKPKPSASADGDGGNTPGGGTGGGTTPGGSGGGATGGEGASGAGGTSSADIPKTADATSASGAAACAALGGLALVASGALALRRTRRDG